MKQFVSTSALSLTSFKFHLIIYLVVLYIEFPTLHMANKHSPLLPMARPIKNHSLDTKRRRLMIESKPSSVHRPPSRRQGDFLFSFMDIARDDLANILYEISIQKNCCLQSLLELHCVQQQQQQILCMKASHVL